MKRGQVPTQVLVPIIAVVVAATLLLILGKGLAAFRVSQEDFSNTGEELEKMLSLYKGKAGKTGTESIDLPAGATRIYIFNSVKDVSSLSFRESGVIEDSVASGIEENVFIIGKEKLLKSFRIKGFAIDSPGYSCIKAQNGMANLLFEGRASGASASASLAENNCTVPLMVREVTMQVDGGLRGDDFEEAMDYYVNALSKTGQIAVKYDMKYDPYTDKTTVKIIFNSALTVQNFKYFEYIPKCLASSVTPGSFVHTTAPQDTEILRADPLVMWDFGGMNSETSFEQDRKITDICRDMLSGFGLAESSGMPAAAATGVPQRVVSTGLAGGQVYPYEDYDSDGILNGNDEYPDDADNDGFPDSWEDAYSYDKENPNSPSSAADDDRDNLANNREYDFDTEPMIGDTDSDTVQDGEEVRLHMDAKSTDTDSDGMPDGFEHDYLGTLDPLRDDTNLDPDNDRLTNIEEYTHGTQPDNEDSDGDLIPDGVEVELGIDPNNPDSDHDGVEDDADEFPDNNMEWDDIDGDGMGDNLQFGGSTKPECNEWFCMSCPESKCTGECAVYEWNYGHKICINRHLKEFLDFYDGDLYKKKDFATCYFYRKNKDKCTNNPKCAWCLDQKGGNCNVKKSGACQETNCKIFPESSGVPQMCTDGTQTIKAGCSGSRSKQKLECEEGKCQDAGPSACPDRMDCVKGLCLQSPQSCNKGVTFESGGSCKPCPDRADGCNAETDAAACCGGCDTDARAWTMQNSQCVDLGSLCSYPDETSCNQVPACYYASGSCQNCGLKTCSQRGQADCVKCHGTDGECKWDLGTGQCSRQAQPTTCSDEACCNAISAATCSQTANCVATGQGNCKFCPNEPCRTLGTTFRECCESRDCTWDGLKPVAERCLQSS